MRSRCDLAALALLAFLASPAHAGTLLRLEVRGAGGSEAVLLSIQESDLRLDRGPLGSDPVTTLIFHGGTGELLYVDHERLETLPYDAHAIHRIAGAMAEGNGPASPDEATPAAEVVDTGEAGTTGTWSWRRFEVRRAGELVAEARATGTAGLGLSAAELGTLHGLFALVEPIADAFGASLGLRFPVDSTLLELTDRGLFPVSLHERAGGSEERAATLARVESRDLGPEHFSDPGYPRPTFEMQH